MPSTTRGLFLTIRTDWYPRMKNELPSPEELFDGWAKAHERLAMLFEKHAEIRGRSDLLRIGQERLRHQFAFALVMTSYMKDHSIKSIEELGGRLWMDGAALDALYFLRSPSGFPSGKRFSRLEDECLLAHCGLERDVKTKKFVQSSSL